MRWWRRWGEPGGLPAYSPLQSPAGTPTHARGSGGEAGSSRAVRVPVMLVATAATSLLLLVIVAGPSSLMLYDLDDWTSKGCPVKILELTQTMRRTYQEAHAMGLDPELGNPTTRKPRTAILNFVKYHIEVVAALTFHFAKLHHNVTVYTRYDEFGMEEVLSPYYTRGFKRFERFFEHFHEYDNIVVATFPTCHLEPLQELASMRLPQRYIAVVHNPDYLADREVTAVLASGGFRVLTIGPHVGAYAREVLEEQGVQLEQDWIAPIMPVINPEDCEPESWTWQHAACNRSARWGGGPQPPVARTAAERRGLCLQGKVDPQRRDYGGIFQEMLARQEQLKAANFSLVVMGKGGGRKDADMLQMPQELLDSGLLVHHSSLPFQEYYEALHSCAAVLPGFASGAYYVNKGSSSVGAAFIAGTPLIATPPLLRAYNFLDESSVFLVEEDASPLDAALQVLAMEPAAREARLLALAVLRTQLYDRNLQVLQRLLGEGHMYKKRIYSGTPREAYLPLYIDMSTPGV